MADFAVDLALIVSLLPVLFMFDAALAYDVLGGAQDMPPCLESTTRRGSSYGLFLSLYVRSAAT